MAHRLTNHEERFAARVDIGSSEQCWLWTGAIHPVTGYAQFWPYGRAGGKMYAHRYSYERFVGPIPDGLTLDHLCHTNDPTCPHGVCEHRRCVNPGHLEPATMSTQQRRAWGWTSRSDGAWLCSEGHEMTPLNSLPSGGCRACFNTYKRDWRETNGNRELEASRLYRSQARRRQFLEDHPEVIGQIDLLGFITCAQRLRRGWTFDGSEWIKPRE